MPDDHIKTDEEGNVSICRCAECELERRLEDEMKRLDQMEL